MKETFSFLSARSGPQPDFPLQEAMGRAIENAVDAHGFVPVLVTPMLVVMGAVMAGTYIWSRRGPK